MVVLRALFIFSLWHGVVVNGSRNDSSYIQINNTESDNYTANVSAVIELHNPAGSNKSIDYKTEHTESPVMSNSSLNPHLNNTASHNTTNTSSTQDLHDGSNTTVCPPFETMAEKDLLRVFSSDFVKRLETWKQNVINSCRYCTKRLDLDSENSFKIKLPVLKATVDRDDPFFSFDTIHPALVREKSQHDLVKVAYLSILELWPLLLLCFSCAALSGMVVWLLDSRSNSEQFSKRFWRGIADGMWWAIVTMTTVGYGDKSPKSFFGRLFATVWMVTGIVLLSMFTAQVSSRLTTQELKSEDYLDDKKIGVPAVLFDSDYELNIMMNAIVEVVEYPVKTTTAFTEMDLESLVVFHCEDKSIDDSWELLQFMQPCKVGAEVLMSIVNGQRFIECVNSQIRTQNYRNGIPRAERKNRQSSCRKLLKSQDKLKFEFKWVYFRDLSQYFIPFGTVIGLIIVAFITGTIWDYCCQRKRNKYSRSDRLPGMNFEHHCSYAPDLRNPDVFECATIGGGIRDCQRLGKKMLISLGGDTCDGSLGTAQNAKKLAYYIWNLFLGGKEMQDKRPFLWTVMDGVDLDIEIGSHKYYPDFVREMRRLMNTDPNKQYLITAAPQCPFPDKWMGPQIQGSALQDYGHEFDYLFLQFYNNYCYPGSQYFVSVVDTWLNWAQTIPNGPLIVLGLPAGPEAAGKSHYYFPPDKLAVAYKKIRDKPGVGGIMFWDCSWVQNNIVNGKDYGTHAFELMRASIVPPTLPPDATILPSTHAPSKTDSNQSDYNNRETNKALNYSASRNSWSGELFHRWLLP